MGQEVAGPLHLLEAGEGLCYQEAHLQAGHELQFLHLVGEVGGGQHAGQGVGLHHQAGHELQFLHQVGEVGDGQHAGQGVGLHHHQAGLGWEGLYFGLCRSWTACVGPYGGNGSSALFSYSAFVHLCPWRLLFSQLGIVDNSFLPKSMA